MCIRDRFCQYTFSRKFKEIRAIFRIFSQSITPWYGTHNQCLYPFYIWLILIPIHTVNELPKWIWKISFCAMEMKLKKSWSPLANTISAFRGSSECPAQGNLKYSFGQFPTMIQLLFQHPIPYKKDFGNSPKVLFLIVTRLLLFLCCVHEVLHTKEVCIIAGYVRFFHVHIVVFIKWYNCPCIH